MGGRNAQNFTMWPNMKNSMNSHGRNNEEKKNKGAASRHLIQSLACHTHLVFRPGSAQRAWHFIIPKANEPPGAEGWEAKKGRRCDDGSTGFIFWLFPCRRARGRQAQPTPVRHGAPRVIQGRHAPRVSVCVRVVLCCVVAALNALGLLGASLPPPHGEARNVAAPRIGTPLPRSRMMVLGRAAKVKGHGELAGPGKGYSRVACDLRCLYVCLSAPRPVAGKPRTIRAQLSLFCRAGGALVLVLLGPIPPPPNKPPCNLTNSNRLNCAADAAHALARSPAFLLCPGLSLYLSLSVSVVQCSIVCVVQCSPPPLLLCLSAHFLRPHRSASHVTMRRGRQSYNLSASEGPPQRPTANATISASRGRGPVCGAQIFVSNSYLRWLATRPVTQHSLFECLPPSDLPVLKSVSLDWAPATPPSSILLSLPLL